MKNLNRKGFTLIEVLAVVAIIAILGMIAVPNVLKVINQGKDSSYDILVQDIKTAGCQLIDELDYVGSDLYHYTNSGIETTKIVIKSLESGKEITVNLQTLVSNGFLTGMNNEDDSDTNENEKVILNPKNNEDIVSCQIKIIKKIDDANHSKVIYTIENESSSDGNCPTTEEYK